MTTTSATSAMIDTVAESDAVSATDDADATNVTLTNGQPDKWRRTIGNKTKSSTARKSFKVLRPWQSNEAS